MPAKDTTVSDSESKTPPSGLNAPGAETGGAETGGAGGAQTGGAAGERPSPTHVTLAVVLQVRDRSLSVLLWQRARDPFEGAWSLPGGYLDPGVDLERSIRTHLARKVDVAELSWLEQLVTLGDPARHPGEWQLATAYLGLVPLGLDPALPPDTAWHPVDDLPASIAFDHRAIVLAGRERLRAKLSYTNIGFALAPRSFTMSELSAIF